MLNTRFTSNCGMQHSDCYYMDSTGKRTALETAFRLDSIHDSNKVVCFNQETGNSFNDSLKA